jgi:hypothetical protein
LIVSEIDERAQANMNLVPDVCRALPNGGDHQSRKCIAERLLEAAREGKTTLGELTHVAKGALEQLRNNPESA